MLVIKCQERFSQIRQYAKDKGVWEKLRLVLASLSLHLGQRYERANGQSEVTRTEKYVELWHDFAHNSFSFQTFDRQGRPWINGGVIWYAGAESGVGAPQFSVTLSERTDERWEIHT